MIPVTSVTTVSPATSAPEPQGPGGMGLTPPTQSSSLQQQPWGPRWVRRASWRRWATPGRVGWEAGRWLLGSGMYDMGQKVPSGSPLTAFCSPCSAHRGRAAL